MKPSLAYPLTGPIKINQPFGANAAYYEKNFGQNGHPGIDFAASHGTPIYAAHDGFAYAIRDTHGGEGIWIYDVGQSFITIYWHLIGNTDANYQQVIPFDYQRHPVQKGDLIGYADNTGAPFESTGDHLHFGIMLAVNDAPINTDNGTQGCVDPSPYFDGTYAHTEQPLAAPTIADVQQDVSEVASLVQNAPTPLNLTFAKKILALIAQMFPFLGN